MNGIRIGGLWVNKDASGKSYLGGYFGQARIRVIKNGFKKADSEPDYVMYIEENNKGQVEAKELDDV